MNWEIIPDWINAATTVIAVYMSLMLGGASGKKIDVHLSSSEDAKKLVVANFTSSDMILEIKRAKGVRFQSSKAIPLQPIYSIDLQGLERAKANAQSQGIEHPTPTPIRTDCTERTIEFKQDVTKATIVFKDIVKGSQTKVKFKKTDEGWQVRNQRRYYLI